MIPASPQTHYHETVITWMSDAASTAKAHCPTCGLRWLGQVFVGWTVWLLDQRSVKRYPGGICPCGIRQVGCDYHRVEL